MTEPISGKYNSIPVQGWRERKKIGRELSVLHKTLMLDKASYDVVQENFKSKKITIRDPNADPNSKFYQSWFQRLKLFFSKTVVVDIEDWDRTCRGIQLRPDRRVDSATGRSIEGSLQVFRNGELDLEATFGLHLMARYSGCSVFHLSCIKDQIASKDIREVVVQDLKYGLPYFTKSQKGVSICIPEPLGERLKKELPDFFKGGEKAAGWETFEFAPAAFVRLLKKEGWQTFSGKTHEALLPYVIGDDEAIKELSTGGSSEPHFQKDRPTVFPEIQYKIGAESVDSAKGSKSEIKRPIGSLDGSIGLYLLQKYAYLGESRLKLLEEDLSRKEVDKVLVPGLLCRMPYVEGSKDGGKTTVLKIPEPLKEVLQRAIPQLKGITPKDGWCSVSFTKKEFA